MRLPYLDHMIKIDQSGPYNFVIRLIIEIFIFRSPRWSRDLNTAIWLVEFSFVFLQKKNLLFFRFLLRVSSTFFLFLSRPLCLLCLALHFCHFNLCLSAIVAFSLSFMFAFHFIHHACVPLLPFMFVYILTFHFSHIYPSCANPFFVHHVVFHVCFLIHPSRCYHVCQRWRYHKLKRLSAHAQ